MRFLDCTFLMLMQLGLGAQSTILFVGGFIESSFNDGHRSSLIPSSMDTYSHATSNDFAILFPTPPESDIEPKILLSHVYNELNVSQLRDVLRAKGAKVSGNKRELVIRLGDILVRTQNSMVEMQQTSTQSQKHHKTLRRNQYDTFSKMTINELKDLLRKENARVSGNKRELVQRLTNIQGARISRPELLTRQHVNTARAEWSILEPTFTLDNGTNTTTEAAECNGDFIELPELSGLLFVNKPAGYSTLPTKQQLDNPTCPRYPCLADMVKEWLYTDPVGQKRLQQAIKCEEKWWDFILQKLRRDPKQQKKLRRERDGQMTKISSFDPRPVHRLDIDTSGIVCIALTPYSLRAANMLFEKKTRKNKSTEVVQKRYEALIEGILDRGHTATGTVNHSIGKVWIDDHNEWACDISGTGSTPFIRPGDVSVHSFVPESLRHAVTAYRVVHQSDESSKNATRVELKPHTGRGHQLRLHMASIGHPIVGDCMHGSKTQSNGGRLCLHASELSLDVWCMSSGRAPETFQICRVHVQSIPPF